MRPLELVGEARRLLAEPDPYTVSAWGRAAALLARQALEESLAGFWRARASGIERLNMRTQLNCAQLYLPSAFAGDLSYTWHALSRATHHHPYELDPTQEELGTLLAQCEVLVQALDVESVQPGSRSTAGLSSGNV
jgi:hypothetical protein